MSSTRIRSLAHRFASASALVALAAGSGYKLNAQEVQQNTSTIIMEGRVVMPDGSAPPKIVGLERICSDINGSTPGPITDKKGHYTWTLQLNPATERACYMRATLSGFSSTQIDFGDLKLEDFTAGTKRKQMPDLVLSPRDGGDSKNIVLVNPSDAPGKSQAPYKLAIKALDAGDMQEGIKQLQAAVQANPKFTDGWNILGGLFERQSNYMAAKDALQHSLENNPKQPAAYLRLARLSNKLGDWDGAAKDEDALLALEKRLYPEIYLHQAITRFEKKDLAGAEESLKTLATMDTAHRYPRSEYVLGRIDLAKGDMPGAKEHIANYVKLDPSAQDLPQIQAQIETIASPEASKSGINLERP